MTITIKPSGKHDAVYTKREEGGICFDPEVDTILNRNECNHVMHNVNKIAIGEFDCSKTQVFEDIFPSNALSTSSTCSNTESSSKFSSSCDEQGENELYRCQSILKTSNSGSRRQNLRTSFSTLEIREYAITLGDNPGGCHGPPLTIEWDHDMDRTKIVELDDYESNRGPRRDRSALQVPNNMKMWMLHRGQCFTVKQLNKAAKDAQYVRVQRRRSSGFYDLYKRYYFIIDRFQRFSRKTKERN